VGGNNVGNSVLKFAPDLKRQSYFTPADQWTLDQGDLDLGSGGVMILPQQIGAHPNQLVTMGKDGLIYLIDRDELGGFAGDSTHGTYGSNLNAVTTIGLHPNTSPTDPAAGPGIVGGPAYFQGEISKGGGPPNDMQYIFYSGGVDVSKGGGASLQAFLLNAGTLTATGQSSGTYGKMGTTPVVTSNNNVSGPGSEIVWAINRDADNGGINTVRLHAYDLRQLILPSASPVADVLVGNWQEGRALIVPTIVNGKVYAACEDHVGVFYCANETKVL
jgi:hypothetical protein